MPQHFVHVDDDELDSDQLPNNSEEDVPDDPKFFEMMEVFRGKMEKLPAMLSNTVRVFLSSTFAGWLQISSINCTCNYRKAQSYQENVLLLQYLII